MLHCPCQVLSFERIFKSAPAFGVDLTAWEMHAATSVGGMFDGATKFIAERQDVVRRWGANLSMHVPAATDFHRIVSLQVREGWGKSHLKLDLKGEHVDPGGRHVYYIRERYHIKAPNSLEFNASADGGNGPACTAPTARWDNCNLLTTMGDPKITFRADFVHAPNTATPGGQAPDDLLFITPDSGGLFLMPADGHEGNYSVRLLAAYDLANKQRGAAGNEATLSTWSFRIASKPEFDTVEAWDKTAAQGREGFVDELVASTSYTLAAPPQFQGVSHSVGCSTLFKNWAGEDHDARKISFSAHFIDRRTNNRTALPACVNSTGGLTISPGPEDVGAYTGRLEATDSNSATALVTQWNFTVVGKPVFTTTTAWEGSGARGNLSSGYPAVFAAGDEAVNLGKPTPPSGAVLCGDEPGYHRVANYPHVNKKEALPCMFKGQDGGVDGLARIWYRMDFDNTTAGANTPAKLDFFVLPGTGEVLAQVGSGASQLGSYRGRLVAIDAAGAETVVHTWDFSIKQNDTEVPRNGPNGLGCQNGGIPVDGTSFDEKFTCDCTQVDARVSGPNCSEDLASSSVATSTTTYVVACVGGATVVALLVVLAVAKRRAYAKANAPVDFETKLQWLTEQGLIHTVADPADKVLPRELRRAWLSMISELGKGEFGVVWKCTLSDAERNEPEYIVAAKVVNVERTAVTGADSADHAAVALASAEADLLNEALLMAQVGIHKHLVALVGVITRGKPKVAVLSFCEHGELQRALKKRAADGAPMEDKVRLCGEIASGMAHLSSCRLVHRDLATRNVLLASGMTCKVADFGLSRRTGDDGGISDYYRSASGVLPVRWTAPEGFTEQKFSPASDVWSFGMTCVEIYQDGELPWSSTRSNPAVMAMVTGGVVHPRPDGCSQQVFAVLVECWRMQPTARPTFANLATFFAQLGNRPRVAPAVSRPRGNDNSLRKSDTNGLLINPNVAANLYTDMSTGSDATHYYPPQTAGMQQGAN